MTKAQLLAKLKRAKDAIDAEEAHIDADTALLEFIGDVEITEAYHAVEKWYA